MTKILEKDPWKTVPPEDRLDFTVVDKPLELLATATVNKIEREWPAAIAIDGAQPLFRLLSKLAVNSYQTIKYFCAEKPPDPGRKIEFVSSAPPILRSLLDEVFTVVFLSVDLSVNVPWYYRSGWREQAEWGANLRERFGGVAGWTEWLENYEALIQRSWKDHYVTPEQKANLRSIRWWPTPARMLKEKELPEATKAFLGYLNEWFYRTLSQGTHLTYPGVASRGGTMLRDKDDPIREGEWLKKRSDTVGDALLFLLAFLTEVNSTLKFDLGQQCGYIWGVWKEYDGSAAELYEMRYQSILYPAG